MRHKDTQKVEQMRAHIEACQASGMSVTDYCGSHEISKANYYYWHKKLQKASGSFMQVTLPTMKQGSNSPIRIHYPNGVSVELNSVVNIALLKELVCCI